MGAETGADGDSSGGGTSRCVYLRKPFSLVSLRAKVREVLEADPARGESR
jgi:hypothetical protein